MYYRDIPLSSTGDDEEDSINIERAAEGWIDAGWKPEDSDPGSYLILKHEDGRLVQIQVLVTR